MSETELQENPLIPNKKLREMFVAMVEMRVLEEHVSGLTSGTGRGVKGRRRLVSTKGEEACRVSTSIDLEPGDLISDAQAGVAMELLAGTKADALLKHVAEVAAGEKQHGVLSSEDGVARLLPWIDDVGDRLRMAMGAASAFKTLKQRNIVVVYVGHGEVSKGLWRQVLPLASRLELPVIFVVLPEGLDRTSGKKKKDGAGSISAKARSCGVPGIPVDASDAVALYRVAQESLGRTRSNGGPVLVECVAYRLEGERKAAWVDPLVQMKEFLLWRKVCKEAWLHRTGDGLRRQIAKAT